MAGRLAREKLIPLRDRIDEIANRNTSVAFISFADSLLLKSNYYIGSHDSDIQYTYDPEKILLLLPEIRCAYRDILQLDVYAILTQGHNEYYADQLIHISDSQNHVSFNSLGLPFAQTQAIEHAARSAIKRDLHAPADIYIDETFYHSLRFKHGFEKNKQPKFLYQAPMATGPNFYFPLSFDLLAKTLSPPSR